MIQEEDLVATAALGSPSGLEDQKLHKASVVSFKVQNKKVFADQEYPRTASQALHSRYERRQNKRTNETQQSVKSYGGSFYYPTLTRKKPGAYQAKQKVRHSTKVVEDGSNGDASVYHDEEKIRNNLDLIDKILVRSQQNDNFLYHHPDLYQEQENLYAEPRVISGMTNSNARMSQAHVMLQSRPLTMERASLEGMQPSQRSNSGQRSQEMHSSSTAKRFFLPNFKRDHKTSLKLLPHQPQTVIINLGDKRLKKPILKPTNAPQNQLLKITPSTAKYSYFQKPQPNLNPIKTTQMAVSMTPLQKPSTSMGNGRPKTQMDQIKQKITQQLVDRAATAMKQQQKTAQGKRTTQTQYKTKFLTKDLSSLDSQNDGRITLQINSLDLRRQNQRGAFNVVGKTFINSRYSVEKVKLQTPLGQQDQMPPIIDKKQQMPKSKIIHRGRNEYDMMREVKIIEKVSSMSQMSSGLVLEARAQHGTKDSSDCPQIMSGSRPEETTNANVLATGSTETLSKQINPAPQDLSRSHNTVQTQNLKNSQQIAEQKHNSQGVKANISSIQKPEDIDTVRQSGQSVLPVFKLFQHKQKDSLGEDTMLKDMGDETLTDKHRHDMSFGIAQSESGRQNNPINEMIVSNIRTVSSVSPDRNQDSIIQSSRILIDDILRQQQTMYSDITRLHLPDPEREGQTPPAHNTSGFIAKKWSMNTIEERAPDFLHQYPWIDQNKKAYQKLRRQAHELAPSQVYNLNSYGQKIDKQQFSSQIRNHSHYLQVAQPKYISKRRECGGERYGGAIVLTTDQWEKNRVV